MADMKLNRLDNATRSRIRSTQILTSLPQIISELVQNSLDAGAKTIEVGVHCDDWMCWVKDDGSGINKEGLSLIAQGLEGGRYSSSKAYNPASLDYVNTFGFRGEGGHISALASAADLSCLEISSRTARSKESWSVISKGGEKLYYGPSLRWRREAAGTVVSVRDAFYNLPIRRKSHPNPARTVELVRRELETFALMFPSVTFILRDVSKESCDSADRGRILTIPRTDSLLSTFRRLYGRALADHIDTIDVQSGTIRIEGFLSLTGSNSKSRQFLYVNRHILDSCELHRLIDRSFSSSTFAKDAYDESGEHLPRPGTRRSPRKGASHPIYVLNLIVPPRDIDNCLEPAKAAVHFQNQDAVASFLAEVIQSFLMRHGFKVGFKEGRAAVSAHDPGAASNKRRKVDYEDIGSMNGLGDLAGKRKSRDLFIRGPSSENEEQLTWVDPNTGRTYLIDPRTGNSYTQEQLCENLDDSGSRPLNGRRTIVDTGSLHHCQRDAGEMPDWIRQALESNNTFATTERAILHLPLSKKAADDTDIARRLSWTKQLNETFSGPCEMLIGTGSSPSCSFSKESLDKVQVLGQVDRKFIACLIGAGDNSNLSNGKNHLVEQPDGLRTLVLVDQHAADERVRVERYLKSLCIGYLDKDGIGVERHTLDPPVPVLLTRFEQDRLMGSVNAKGAFRDWGFDLVEIQAEIQNYGANENDDGYGMVYCGSVPEVIAEKLLANPGSDLREVVKGYLARLEAENVVDSGDQSRETVRDSLSMTDADEFAWLKALRQCPRELIELVNSRACRGAIMFNDQLSVEQCKRLLRQLSMTAFPFQCAHGRPSVVPLTTIGSCQKSEDLKKPPRPIDWSNLC